MPTLVPAQLAFTGDGTPYSAEYDDVYHAAGGGLEQTRHVFLAGNGLPQRWRGRERFVIIETGFGLGLNFLATWQTWRDDAMRCGHLDYISFEKHPFSATDLAALLARWPELAALADQLQRQWPELSAGAHRLGFDEGRVMLTLHFGDAAESVTQQPSSVRADAFFLDGFSPAKNPALWSPRVLGSLAELAAPGATLATWTVAGAVRQGLAAAGFALTRSAGFGTKREMLRGVLPGSALAPGKTCNNPKHQ